jgi:hypothetical protein
MISPVGDLIRYFPRAVGPSLDDTFTPSLASRTKKVKDCAWDASGPVGPYTSLGYAVLLYHARSVVIKPHSANADRE